MDYKKSAINVIKPSFSFLICFYSIVTGSFLLPISVSALTLTEINSVSITAVVPGPVIIPPNNNFGGGGSGGSQNSPTILGNDVIFRGLAYPGSMVSLLQDGVVVAEVPASPDGSFEISINGLLAGVYNFGVRAQDGEKRISTVQVYTVHVTAGVTTLVKGIFLPPTISIDKKEVRQGDTLIIVGRSVPQAEITVMVHSATELIKKTTADASGAWLYKLNTSELELGDHQTKAQGATETDTTAFSKIFSFSVGSLTTFVDKDVTDIVHDLNTDGKVNLIDFSILAYWYKRVSPPKAIDLNNDGKVNLIDFSILAYYWTG